MDVSSISTRCDRDEIRISSAVGYSGEHQNAIFLGHCVKIPPQLHEMVALGWQYAVLAKCVYGVKVKIWEGERVVMLCLGSRKAP